MRNIDKLKEAYPENEFIYFSDLDNAIIGIDYRGNAKDDRLVYSARKIINQLISTGLDPDEALDFYYYNIEGIYLGPNTPLIVYDLDLNTESKDISVPAKVKDLYITFLKN